MSIERNPLGMNMEDMLASSDVNSNSEAIEMDDPTIIAENPDGTVDVSLSQQEIDELEAEDMNEKGEFYDNLVDELSEEALTKLGEDVVSATDSDEMSRTEWMQTITKGMGILGIGIEELSEPFEGACSAAHPLILEAAVKFQAKAGAELLPANGPVKTQVLGKITREKEEQATRVREHMNWQVTTQMTEYYPDKERMLFYLPLIGSAFTKTYWDSADGRPVSEFIPVDQFVVSFSCTDLERARRYTHIIYKTKDDLKRDIASGLYADRLEEIGEPGQLELTDFQKKQGELIGLVPGENNYDSMYTLLEQHVNLYLPDVDNDDNEIAKPYIVTVDKGSNIVIGIRRNWKEEDEKYQKKVIFTHYPFVPGLGFYGLGYIHLLGNLQMTLTTALRALVDAGQFATLPAGFKTKNIRMPKDQGALKPGEWRDIETAGQKLAEAFVPLPYKEPSTTLFNLLGFIESRGLKFADSTEQVIADSTNYGPVGTTMALLDASTKFFSSAHRRLHYSQKRELQILAEINSEYIETEFTYNIPGEEQKIFRDDYANSLIQIIPVSDPNISSNAHRITLETTKVQAIQQLGPAAVSAVNMKEMLKRMFLALGEKEIDKIITPDEEAKPQDPISDILSVVQGKPIKAFPGQNHDAHMQVKASWLEDPANGGTPIMANVAPVLQANIREHMIMKYQEQIAGAMQNVQPTGAATDGQTAEMIIAEAAQMVAENNKAAQMVMQQGTPDAKIAQAELIKAQTGVLELDHKRKKDFANAAIAVDELNFEKVKEANRNQAAKDQLLAGLTKERMKLGKDMAISAVNNLSKLPKEEKPKTPKE
jgi:hypothetical protein